MSSHQVAHVERVADHVAILHDGRLVEEGNTDDLMSRHKIIEAVVLGAVTRQYSNGDGDAISRSLTAEGAQGVRVIDCSLEDIYLHAVGDQRSL